MKIEKAIKYCEDRAAVLKLLGYEPLLGFKNGAMLCTDDGDHNFIFFTGDWEVELRTCGPSYDNFGINYQGYKPDKTYIFMLNKRYRLCWKARQCEVMFNRLYPSYNEDVCKTGALMELRINREDT